MLGKTNDLNSCISWSVFLHLHTVAYGSNPFLNLASVVLPLTWRSRSIAFPAPSLALQLRSYCYVILVLLLVTEVEARYNL